MIAIDMPTSYDTLLAALITVESRGDINAVNEFEQAYGVLQIRQGYLDDVNQMLGTKIELKNLLGESGAQLSRIVFSAYMLRYCTSERFGRPVTDEDRARCHNGGPAGYKKKPTVEYWEKVSSVLEKNGA